MGICVVICKESVNVCMKVFEIGFALFDSYVVVNSFIARRNHVLSGRPSKERAYKKYGIREARLELITRWAKRCSRHYKRTQPHRQKRLRMVLDFRICIELCVGTFHELKATPVKPDEAHHDKPLPLPAGSGACVVCKRRTYFCCWGCTSTLGGVIPVCPQSKRPQYNVQLHNMQNEV